MAISQTLTLFSFTSLIVFIPSYHNPIPIQGNFWSATCDHINTRESLDGKKTTYLSGEMWISNPGDVRNQAKLTMYNEEKGLYSNLILPEEYAL